MKVSRIAPIIFALAVASVLSCAGGRQKSVVSEVLEPRPVATLETADLIFASDSASAESAIQATNLAKQLAVAELGRKTENLVASVTRQLAEDTGLAQDSTLFTKFTELCEAASDSIILRLSRIEDQTVKPEPDGLYKANVSVSMPVGAVKLVIIELIKIKQSIYVPLQGSEAFAQIARATEEYSSISKQEEEKLRAWLQQYGARQNFELEKLSENLADSTGLASVDQSEKPDDEGGGITGPIREHHIKTSLEKSQADSTQQKTPIRSTRGEEWNHTTATSVSEVSDSEASSKYSVLDEIMAQLPQANFALRAPDTMLVNESKHVVLLMSAGMASVVLKDTIIFAFDEPDGKGKISEDSVKYTPIMEAELRGEGLDITLITPGKQFVGRQNYTRWVWSVKSREPGDKTLDAALNLVIERSKHEPMKHAIKTFKKNKTKRIMAAKKNRAALNSLKTAISRWIKINFFVRLFHHRTNS